MRSMALVLLLSASLHAVAEGAPPASPAAPSPEALQLYAEGKRLYDGEDYVGALAVFDRCAAMDPQVARWQYNRGLALRMLERDAQAAEAFRASLALDPSYKTREIAQKLADLPAVPCCAGYLDSRIALDGRVFFCCAPIEVGDLEHQDFAEVWSGPRYDAVRARLHRGELFPACARCGKYDLNYSAHRAAQSMTAADSLLPAGGVELP